MYKLMECVKGNTWNKKKVSSIKVEHVLRKIYKKIFVRENSM